MSYFMLGKNHLSENFSDYINSNDRKAAVKKFSNKYWGTVDREQWDLNEQILEGNKGGDLVGRYVSPSGITFFIITVFSLSRTIFLTAEEFEDGELERIKEHYYEAMNRKKGRS